jgi:hypothetical protein
MINALRLMYHERVRGRKDVPEQDDYRSPSHPLKTTP